MANFEEGLLMSNYRRLLKNNKEISGIRDLFSSYVSDVLSKEDKETFQENDFQLFEGYLETLKPYHQVLQDKGIDCSIEMTEMFILGQSVEEFRELIENSTLKDLIKHGEDANIRIFFGKEGIIKNKKECEEFFTKSEYSNIISLILFGGLKNMKLFFGKDGIVKNMDDLILFTNNSKFEAIMSIILFSNAEKVRLYFGREGVIGNIQDLITNPRVDGIISLIRYGNIEEKRNRFIDFAEKYKSHIDSVNPYFGTNFPNNSQESPANFFSLLDIRAGIHTIGEQKGGEKHIVGEQDFFAVNQKKDDITLEVQLAINRLFAPLFPMTRLLKLINGETNYVSVDVENNPSGIEISKLKDSIPSEINKFFIMIYQFLCLDYDRYDTKNLGKSFTIYDFDYIFSKSRDELSYVNGRNYLNFFNGIFNQPSLFEEMREILYTLKDYLISEVDILIPYYERQGKEDVVLIFRRLRTRLEMLNFSNLIYFNEQVNPEVEEFARKVDSENYV